MGQAFDRDGAVVGEAFGATKREVFDKLQNLAPEAAEIRIRSAFTEASSQMPRYRCHKEVWALKIERVQFDADTARVENRETDGSALLFVEAPYALVRVDATYVRKHEPKAGGYFVVYDDGYRSFSPAEPFEAGYTKL